MNKTDRARIAISLDHIAMLLDTENYQKIQPYLSAIREICARNIESEERITDENSN